MQTAGQKRKRATLPPAHPYLSGNFAPIDRTIPLTPCSFVGTIPRELAGGQYVRNGANPLANSDQSRDAHWFDGDGMLSGVLFRRHIDENGETVRPGFVNQYIQTDLYRHAVKERIPAQRPLLPSIATLINPAAGLVKVSAQVCRAGYHTLKTHVRNSKEAIRRISVANTGIIYHDGRALATCESGPPLRVQLPELETVGWYNDGVAEGEFGVREGSTRPGGLMAFFNEWATGHPKVDPCTDELLLFHSTFVPPYVRYTVTSSTSATEKARPSSNIVKAPVPGMTGAKMMHDFGVSNRHTVIMDLPLSLDPLNLVKGKPVVSYEANGVSRFGVFPRHCPSAVRWFETSACCIFHTANTWDEFDSAGNVIAVNMLACRLNSASVIFSAGNLTAPLVNRKKKPAKPRYSDNEGLESVQLLEDGLEKQSDPDDLEEEEQCLLHHYRFSLQPPPSSFSEPNIVTHSRPLTALPFEFPTIRPDRAGRFARYIYGCSTRTATPPTRETATLTPSFGAALGKTAKIDVLAKIDVATLLARRTAPDHDLTADCSSRSALDTRTADEILASNSAGSNKNDDPVKCFAMPPGWYAQEAFFVPASNSSNDDDEEDKGYLLFYAFDESQLPAPTAQNPHQPPPPTATSELWILDATDMTTLLARISLPQRVPYGLHGRWFTEQEIATQRPYQSLRNSSTAPIYPTPSRHGAPTAAADDDDDVEASVALLFPTKWGQISRDPDRHEGGECWARWMATLEAALLVTFVVLVAVLVVLVRAWSQWAPELEGSAGPGRGGFVGSAGHYHY